jgi:hypothetical protein
MDPKGAGSELQESAPGAPLLRRLLSSVVAPVTVALAMLTGARAEPARPSFARDVAPVLGRYCVGCHGATEVHAGLRLDSYAGLMRGGEEGPAVVPGDPRSSFLMAKIERRHRPPMPPRRALPAALVARIRAWIAAGAPP